MLQLIFTEKLALRNAELNKSSTIVCLPSVLYITYNYVNVTLDDLCFINNYLDCKKLINNFYMFTYSINSNSQSIVGMLWLHVYIKEW